MVLVPKFLSSNEIKYAHEMVSGTVFLAFYRAFMDLRSFYYIVFPIKSFLKLSTVSCYQSEPRFIFSSFRNQFYAYDIDFQS